MMNVDTSEAELKVAKLMGEYVDRVGMGAPYVVKTESGMLARTLINITPPKDKKKTAASIADRIHKRFAKLENPKHSFTESTTAKSGNSDVRWYAWTSKALYGVARENDMTKASVDEVYQLSKKVTKAGRIESGRHGKQKVFLFRKTLISKKQTEAVIKRIQGHIGRLKAGWIPAWKAAGSLGKLPRIVIRHADGARGSAIDGTGNTATPSFTLINTANGVGELTRSQNYLLKAALETRAKAMATKLKLYLSGKIKHDPALEAISE